MNESVRNSTLLKR